MQNTVHTRQVRQRGFALIQSIFIIVVSMAMSSLAIDVGIFMTARCELQRTADAAALAAADAFAVDGNATTARLTALEYVTANPVNGTVVLPSAVTVTFGHRESGTFAADVMPYNAVKVCINRTRAAGTAVKLYCSDLFGVASVDARATAVSRVTPPGSTYNLVGIEWANFGSIGVLAGINGRVASNGNITIGMPLGIFTGVQGDVRSWNGTVKVGSLAYVTGSTARLSEELNYPSVHLPTRNDNSRLGAMLDGGGNLTTAVGASIPAGTYVVNNLTILAGVALRLDGPVTFYVKGACNIAASVNLLGNSNMSPSNFKVRVLPGGQVNFLANLLVPLNMDLYAPDSDIVVAVGVNQFKGRLIGRTLNIVLPVAGSFVEDRTLVDALEGARQAALVTW